MSGKTLTAGGDRNVKITVDIAKNDVLSRFEAQVADGSIVDCLDISKRVWQEEHLKVLEPFLKEKVVSTIRHLNMDDIIASLETSIGLKTIQFVVDIFKEAPFLERIDANDNALGERAGEIMRPLFGLPTLKRLSLDNCGMSIAVGTQLVSSILPPGRDSTILTHLSLGRNQMHPEGAVEIAKIIRASPNLVSFGYSGSRPLKAGTKALMEAFAATAENVDRLSLKEFDMNDSSFGTGEDDDDCIDSLIAVLQKCPDMETLILNEGVFGPDGTASVIQAIKSSGAKLKKLGLGGVGLREDEAENGVDALVELLESPTCAGLEELNLDTNELEDEGTRTIIEALAAVKLPKLVTLSLQDNQIMDDGAQALVDNKVPSLKVLNLNGNDEIPPELAAKLFHQYKGTDVIFDEEIELEQEEGDDDAVQVVADAGVDDLAGFMEKAEII